MDCRRDGDVDDEKAGGDDDARLQQRQLLTTTARQQQIRHRLSTCACQSQQATGCPQSRWQRAA